MRLSVYAKKMGVTYKAAFRWWKAGHLGAYQIETGTIIVREPATAQESASVALYACVSSADQKEDLDRQMQRLKDYAAHGYQVSKMVSELASGLNDTRPKLMKLLTDASVGVIVVEHRDRLTRLKSRNKGIGGFRLTGSIHIHTKTIQLPRLGKLRLKEQNYLPVGAKVALATVTERAGRWYVSVQLENEIGSMPAGQNAPIGIDLGIKALATCSDGTSYPNPKALRTRLKQLRRASKRVSSKKKGSKNRGKARKKLARVHARIANLRRDTLQKTTTAIVTKATSNGYRASCMVIEDLNISGMLKNRRLSRAIADVGLSEFRRQLTYKLEAAGIPLKVVSRWYPSSKTCSCCGWVNKDLTLADRTFVCTACGLILDRDVNAARNLAHAASELLGLPPVRRELTPVDIVSDLGNQATVGEAGTEHGSFSQAASGG